ncbi:MAG TPA: cyclic nucleotide-binding domain-containing protein [Polyangiales bacterium]
MTQHELSPLDQAHAHRLAGDELSALRLAIACAEALPDAPGPVALIARVLVDQDKTLRASEIAARLVDANIRRGDLPSAVIASTLALDAGEDPKPLLTSIAQAFGKGSVRLSEASPSPPPFPRTVAVDAALSRLTGDALFERADAVVTKFLASHDSASADGRLPTLPLFSALTPTLLFSLLSAVRVEEFSGGSEIVRQGDVGHEAFVTARGQLRVVRREGGDETTLAQLGAGSMFGEMALISESPRSASVIALEPAQLLVIDRAELERAATHAQELALELSTFCRQRMQANLARHARVLSGLPPGTRHQLLNQLPVRLFEQGEPLIERDQEAERILILASGAVSVSVPEGNERLVLATLGPGDVVGEISMILRRKATADVTAMYPTVAYEISRDALTSLMRAHPPLLVELYLLATRRDDEIRAASESEVLTADDLVLV